MNAVWKISPSNLSQANSAEIAEPLDRSNSLRLVSDTAAVRWPHSHALPPANFYGKETRIGAGAPDCEDACCAFLISSKRELVGA
jgi:hypothetical protein